MADQLTLILLATNWLMLVLILYLTIKAINSVKPFIEKVEVAKTMWYLYIAFGYSLIAVTLFTSWVIWTVGGIWGLIVLFMTWFILVILYTGHKSVNYRTLKRSFNLNEK
ncbi:MAG: hypothetical protein COV47_00425 [Candidatus Diapherotrites archaeon CG11_big_fil_rev_8_21_14_0_20_37_9]|nr:MAG: hypothetical protein COV47_00425 [Candidatus Diapherotrites archaeon CG11_big_fil_rev_8_21_14_0_20_37_9]